MSEQENDDVWIFHRTGTAVTGFASEFQEDMGTKDDATGPRCEAAGGPAVMRERLAVVADTSFSFKF